MHHHCPIVRSHIRFSLHRGARVQPGSGARPAQRRVRRRRVRCGLARAPRTACSHSAPAVKAAVDTHARTCIERCRPHHPGVFFVCRIYRDATLTPIPDIKPPPLPPPRRRAPLQRPHCQALSNPGKHPPRRSKVTHQVGRRAKPLAISPTTGVRSEISQTKRAAAKSACSPPQKRPRRSPHTDASTGSRMWRWGQVPTGSWRLRVR